MEKKTCSDQEFISLFEELGPAKLAAHLQLTTRRIYERRVIVEHAHKIKLVAPHRDSTRRKYDAHYPARTPYVLKNGIAIIVSDCHYWPDIISTAHRGAIHVSKQLKPKLFIVNGDAFDGATISRFGKSGWDHKPSVMEELEAVQERTDELRLANPSADLFWLVGNHDSRFENKLANSAPEFEGVQGFMLKDRFPHWTFGMSLWINEDVVVKHRFKGGVHATHNNALHSGKSIFTGHLHSLKVTAFTDYNGTRYGGDSGTLADPNGPQFTYSEDNPNNHRSGFLVLTFHEGKLLMPEICRVVDENHVEFRGSVVEV